MGFFSGLCCYSWVNYRFSGNFPFMRIVLPCFEGNEPAMYSQNFSCNDCFPSITDGARAVDKDIARANGRFVPSLEPIEKCLCERGLRFFGW